MNIRINSNFQFSVTEISYAPNGGLQITLSSDENQKTNDNALKKMAIIVC